MHEGEYLPGKAADRNTDVFQDVDATFFLLLAIYFPAVTGILTGTNMSGNWLFFDISSHSADYFTCRLREYFYKFVSKIWIIF